MDIALIGYGRWGRNLARNFNALGALTALSDSSKRHLQEAKEHYPHLQFFSKSEALWDSSVNAVAIATPPETHFTLAKAALLAHKDLFVEKPLCLSGEEAHFLNTLAQKQGRVLMVGHLLLYHRAFLKIEALLAKGVIGKLKHIHTQRMTAGSATTPLWDLAPHDLAVILALINREQPVHIEGHEGGVYLRFKGGVTAEVEVGYDPVVKKQKMTFTGDLGQLVFDDTLSWGNKLSLFGQPISLSVHEPLKDECQAFLMCCKNRTPPKSDGELALLVTEVLQEASCMPTGAR